MGLQQSLTGLVEAQTADPLHGATAEPLLEVQLLDRRDQVDLARWRDLVDPAAVDRLLDVLQDPAAVSATSGESGAAIGTVSSWHLAWLTGLPELVVRERIADMRAFDSGGPHDPESNYLFGEGGAGTYSDGKLYTRIKDRRIRFLLELLADIKAKAGPDFPVGLRINGEDYIDGGWTLDEALRLAPILERNGADYLHVSAGVYGSTQLTIPSMYVEHGCFVHLAEAVKQVVTIPVVGVGRVKSPELADRILKEGRADVVAMGRALMVDPQVLLLDEPTRGIDVGAKSEIFQIMSRLALEGFGIVFVSSELKEVMAMSDRILVLSKGEVVAEFEGHRATEKELVDASAVGHGTTAMNDGNRSETVEVIQ